MFQFNRQLTVGANGEEIFHSLYPRLEKADGIKFDFICNGKSVELKTDTYAMDKTPNFFMERYSDVTRATNGGPWRAAHDKVTYFVYMYLKERQCFWFNPATLVEFLDGHVVGKRMVEIPNKTWTTTGYLIRRGLVKHLVMNKKQTGEAI